VFVHHFGHRTFRARGIDYDALHQKNLLLFREKWEQGPAGNGRNYGLTSIVIVTHNQLEFTRQCVESVRRYTDEPYELMFVDNGSTDGTLDYLKAVPNGRVIANPDNRGFPAAVNQGIALANGRQVLLLNNDCVAPRGWLRRLLGVLHSDAQIGLVGPCSNCVSGEQQVPVDYTDLEGLDRFAEQWADAHAGEVADTDRLVGFCLLIKREVLERVGLLDERFGTGCFEDDDYCLRAIHAGFRAVIAREAFVHHYGGRTFVGSGVDFAGLMAWNRELFRAKWERGASGPLGLPPVNGDGASAPATGFRVCVGPGGGLRLKREDIVLSLCMIVRDNARTIGPCLESIRPHVDEMVVVDTGSTDDTPRIAQRLGARVFHFPWCDSFSSARNESLRHARGRWVFWMDSDDTIDEANGRQLRPLALREAGAKVLGYVVKVHCPGPGEDGANEVTVVDHVKLFRNLPALRFEGRIHEQILPAINRAGGEVLMTDLFVVHSGYDHSPKGQARKLQRDLRLLHLELEEQPDHPFTLFNLGMTYTDMGEYDKAVGFLKRCLDESAPMASHVRKAYAYLVHCYERLGRGEEAWEACQEGLRSFPHDAELGFRRGNLLHARGRLAEAIGAYRAVLETEEGPHFASVVRGIKGFLTRQNLAAAYLDAGDLARAEEQYRLVVGEVPYYRAGWRGLGEVLLRQGKKQEVRDTAEKLVAEPRLRAEGRVLGVKAAAGEGDTAGAWVEVERAGRETPADLEPLEVLCQALFEKGDLPEAERALRELVRREPESGAAHHNLGMVYQRMGQPNLAAEAYRKALDYRPDWPATYMHLGNAFKDMGDLEGAERCWKEARRFGKGMSHAGSTFPILGSL
jgi:GT2 family glycosyltransferase/tetratricopeptide (TPR) repeat protein